ETVHAGNGTAVPRGAPLLDEPTVADDERLAGERVGREGREEEGDGGDVGGRRELAVDGVAEHHLLDDLLLAYAELPGLFGDLLGDERRADEPGTDDVGAHLVLGAFLGDHLGEADQAVLGG